MPIMPVNLPKIYPTSSYCGILGPGTNQAASTGNTVFVNQSGTDLQRGSALTSALGTAAALTPGGSALASTNRARVVLYPGNYQMTANTTFSHNYVDLASLTGDPASVTIYTGASVILATQTCNDIQLNGLTLKGTAGIFAGYPSDATASTTFVINASDNTASRYTACAFLNPNNPGRGSQTNDDGGATYNYTVWGTSNINGTWQYCRFDPWSLRAATNKQVGAQILDCIFNSTTTTLNEAPPGSWSIGGDATGETVNASCLIARCQVGDYSIGSCLEAGCNVAATIQDSIIGNYSVAVGWVFSGTMSRCIVGRGSIGSTQGSLTGTVQDSYIYSFDTVANDSQDASVNSNFSLGGLSTPYLGASGGVQGLVKNCRIIGAVQVGPNGTLSGCFIDNSTSIDTPAIVVTDASAKLIGNTLLASPTVGTAIKAGSGTISLALTGSGNYGLDPSINATGASVFISASIGKMSAVPYPPIVGFSGQVGSSQVLSSQV